MESPDKPGHDGFRVLRRLLIAFTGLAGALASALPAYADLKLCNRMSYVVEAALGIDDKGATATRGWFRLDPAQCVSVAQGDIAAERLMVHVRALPVYGASPLPAGGTDNLCVAPGNFVIAAARQCRAGQTPAAFTEIKPSPSEDGAHRIAWLAEGSDYDEEQARLAGVQRLLLIAGFDVTPIDGVDGPKTQAALARFLRARGLPADAPQSPTFFATMVAAVQAPSAAGLTWCNETPHRVMAAVGSDDGKAIVTRGWYRIEPGKCLNPDVTGQPKRLFSFAEAVDADGKALSMSGKRLAWGGATMLCTREAKFESGDQSDCAARGFASTGFAAVDLGGDAGRTLRFTLP
jgi:uncharacterized membrane protein